MNFKFPRIFYKKTREIISKYGYSPLVVMRKLKVTFEAANYLIKYAINSTRKNKKIDMKYPRKIYESACKLFKNNKGNISKEILISELKITEEQAEDIFKYLKRISKENSCIFPNHF